MIPAAVRFQAENLFAVTPEPPSELPVELIRNDRYCLFLTPIPTLSFVERIRVDEADVEATVREVRELLRARGRAQCAWSIAPGATPSDLERRLLALGMVPYEEAPLEPSYAAMAIVTEPTGPVAEGIEVREAASHEDVDAFADVEHGVIGIGSEDSDEMRKAAHTLFDLRRQGLEVQRFYLALREGEPVGAARATLLAAGVNLSGGSVVPGARGQGVYRALVKARWRDAVERGTPALTVQAGKMSRPILERLGFTTVSTVAMLCDRFA